MLKIAQSILLSIAILFAAPIFAANTSEYIFSKG